MFHPQRNWKIRGVKLALCFHFFVSSSKELKGRFTGPPLHRRRRCPFHPQRNWKSNWRRAWSSSLICRFILKGIERVSIHQWKPSEVCHGFILKGIESRFVPRQEERRDKFCFILKGIERRRVSKERIREECFILKGIESGWHLKLVIMWTSKQFHPQRNWKIFTPYFLADNITLCFILKGIESLVVRNWS